MIRGCLKMRPNVLIFHTDQQSLWTISLYARLVYGDKPLVETPNIDRIGKEGAVFTDFFANSAVCTPSRGGFLTGRYPHYHEAYKNNGPLNRSESFFSPYISGAQLLPNGNIFICEGGPCRLFEITRDGEIVC